MEACLTSGFTCSYESYIVFCVAKPLMGNLPSARCRKVSVQQLLRCRILFSLSIQRAAGEVVLLLAALCFPERHCCLQLLREKGKSCRSAVSTLPGTRVERLNHTWWQGRTVVVTGSSHSHAAGVAACRGGRARGSRDPPPCAGSCYVL